MKHKAKRILVVMLTVMIIFGYLTPLVADEANAATADLDLCDLGCELEHCDGDHCDGGHYDEENCDWGHCDEEICDGVICDGDNCDGDCYSEHCGDCECENGHCDEQCDSIGVVEVSSSSSVGRMTKEQAACSHVWNVSAATCTVQKWCKKCGYVAQKALGHSTVYKETKAATCTTQGTYVYTCTRSGCGYSTGGYIPSLGHKAGAAATCTSPQKCTRCGVTLKDKLGHSYGAAATCTTAQKCTRCGVTLKNALGHSAGAAATCTTAQKCTRCGVTLKNALGHDAPYKETKAPTCTTQGEYVYKCTRCSYSTGGYIPALGHSAGAAATCTTAQKCTRCSTTLNKELGHAWDSGTVTKAATCTATGTKTFKCSRCGGTKTETINALGHSAGAAATCTAPQKCTRCNTTLKNALGHAWDNGTVTKAATCTATGTKTFKCTRCATTKTESIPVIAHSYTWKVTTSPTCTKEGVESYKCSCGNVSQTRAVAKIAHNCEWKVTVQASCKGAGKEEYICKVCGAVTNGRSIQYYGGHTWDRTAATCTAAQKCTVCGTIGQEALGHAWDNGTVTKGASHSATGVKTFKCTRTGCTATKTETVPVIAHSYTWVVTTPSTCTKEGVESYKCSCGDVSQTRSVAKKAHNGVWATTVQPSCAGSGTEECTCKDCGAWLGARSIQYYGDHTWNRAAADCTHDKKCTVCGLVDQKAPGHTYTSEATCTKDKKCDVCGYVAKKALGHNYQTVTTKQPTCTEQGVFISKCTRCNDVAKDGNGYIGATGHKWKDNLEHADCERAKECTVCGFVAEEATGHCWQTLHASAGGSGTRGLGTAPAHNATAVDLFGETKFICKHCNTEGNSASIKEANGEHDWVFNKDVTETNTGYAYREYRCLKCTDTLQDEIYTVELIFSEDENSPFKMVKTYNQDVRLLSLAKEGYVFKGWSRTANGVVDYEPGAFYAENASVTLYGIWELKTYQVKVDILYPGDRDGRTICLTKKHGVDLKLPDCQDTAAYNFLGFRLSGEGEIKYGKGVPYTENADVKLTAVFQSLEYTIHMYDKKHGGEMKTMTVRYGDEIELPCFPFAVNYDFLGYSEDENATEPEYRRYRKFVANGQKELYAIWHEHTWEKIEIPEEGIRYRCTDPSCKDLKLCKLNIHNEFGRIVHEGWLYAGEELFSSFLDNYQSPSEQFYRQWYYCDNDRKIGVSATIEDDCDVYYIDEPRLTGVLVMKEGNQKIDSFQLFVGDNLYEKLLNKTPAPKGYSREWRYSTGELVDPEKVITMEDYWNNSITINVYDTKHTAKVRVFVPDANRYDDYELKTGDRIDSVISSLGRKSYSQFIGWSMSKDGNEGVYLPSHMFFFEEPNTTITLYPIFAELNSGRSFKVLTEYDDLMYIRGLYDEIIDTLTETIKEIQKKEKKKKIADIFAEFFVTGITETLQVVWPEKVTVRYINYTIRMTYAGIKLANGMIDLDNAEKSIEEINNTIEDAKRDCMSINARIWENLDTPICVQVVDGELVFSFY